MDKNEIKYVKNPRETANIISILTFKWIFNIFRKGYKKDLDVSDLYSSLEEHKSRFLGDKISQLWKKETEKSKINSKSPPKLLNVLAKGFYADFILLGLFLMLIEFAIRLIQPTALAHLLKYFNKTEDISQTEALYWCIGLIATIFLDCVISHNVLQGLNHVGMKIRVACSSLIYRKVLRISKNNSDGDMNIGQIINLLTSDVISFDNCLYSMHYVWISLTQAVIVLYLIYDVVDTASIGGIATILICFPVYACLGRWITHLTKLCVYRADERLRLTNEIINGIKVIKMYVWENPFIFKEDAARRKELRAIRKEAITSEISCSFEIYIPRVCLFITILSYVMMGNSLNAQKVYLITSYYNLVRVSMFGMLPFAIKNIAKITVAIRRIQKFLLMDENSPKKYFIPPNMKDNGLPIIPRNDDISFENYYAKWSLESEKFTLSNININIKRGSVVAIIGEVGSGKSTFVQAILNEVPCSKGELFVNGKLSYASQEPWIFGSSIRQNILFGKDMDDKRYKKVINVCQLSKDLKQLPNGDQSLVGEKGTSLSGGQCARINLARAIYHEADIYLLDDILSAVDASVGKSIFNDCIKNFLKEKTVILVTHQIQYLRYVDKIIVMNNGIIQAQGTFSEICSLDIDILKMIQVENESNNKTDPNQDLVDKRILEYEEVEYNEDVKEEEETRGFGSIKSKVYMSYFSACRSYILIFLVILISILFETSCISVDYFVAYWTAKEEKLSLQNSTSTNNDYLPEDRSFYIYVYGSIILFTIVITMIQAFVYFITTVRISRFMHGDMFNSILYTSMTFFNQNPLGRIMNRFSKDMNIIDIALPRTVHDVKQCVLNAFTVFAVVIIVNPWFSILAVLILAITFFARRFYVKTSRNIRRLEGITKSPVLKHLTDTVYGLITIRALKAEEALISEFDNHQNLHSSAWFLFISGARAFGLYTEFIFSAFTSIIIFSLYMFNDKTEASYAGLVITQCMLLTTWMSYTLRRITDLENEITSVERISEYTQLPKEPGLQNDFNMLLPENWPDKGKVEFRNVSLTYNQKTLALKNLSFIVQPIEKVGIVGRTGAGKSSIINVLFRLAEFDGEIIIDEFDTKRMKLGDLRSKLSIIPQQPVLFRGSLRKNLDPLDIYSDMELWQALEDVKLKNMIQDDLGLEMKIMDGGTNFSIGQRQLLCLARAIVKKDKIIILDEATANVDPYTDELIQKTIRRKFSECTVLIIAHRLVTVMDCDKILVMDDGKVVEFDHPFNLFKKEASLFYNMVQKTDEHMAEKLYNIAKENFNRKFKDA